MNRKGSIVSSPTDDVSTVDDDDEEGMFFSARVKGVGRRLDKGNDEASAGSTDHNPRKFPINGDMRGLGKGRFSASSAARSEVNKSKAPPRNSREIHRVGG